MGEIYCDLYKDSKGKCDLTTYATMPGDCFPCINNCIQMKLLMLSCLELPNNCIKVRGEGRQTARLVDLFTEEEKGRITSGKLQKPIENI